LRVFLRSAQTNLKELPVFLQSVHTSPKEMSVFRRCSFFPFGVIRERERGDLRGEALIYQIHPLESEIGGDLEPPPTLLAPTSCIFIFIVDCLLVALVGFPRKGFQCKSMCLPVIRYLSCYTFDWFLSYLLLVAFYSSSWCMDEIDI
jgi:hypothetical protein